jgi:hypothetical protein
MVHARGIEYIVRTTDGKNTVADSVPAFVQVSVENVQQPTVLEKDTWHLVSAPLQKENDSIAFILDTLGAYDITKWRLFSYENGNYGEYTKDNPGGFTPGKGFWLYAKQDIQLKTGKAVSPNPATPLEVTLTPGWNIVSSPFLFNADWYSVTQELTNQGQDDCVFGPYGFDGRQWTFPLDSLYMSPWKGYAIKNTSGEPVTLRIPGKEYDPQNIAKLPAAKVLKSRGDLKSWRARVQVDVEDRQDHENHIGVVLDARDQWDIYDYPKPPAGMESKVRMYVHHPKWKKNAGAYMSDFRSPFTEGQAWSFSIMLDSTVFDKTARVSYDNMENIPQMFEVYVIDQDRSVAFNLKAEGAYEFEVMRKQKNLLLLVGTEAYIKKWTKGLLGVPKVYALFQNYPNPFNPVTIIKFDLPEKGDVTLNIYNARGQLVRALIKERLDSGYYSRKWDGRDALHRRVGSGVYFYRIEVNHFTKIRKMMLVK